MAPALRVILDHQPAHPFLKSSILIAGFLDDAGLPPAERLKLALSLYILVDGTIRY